MAWPASSSLTRLARTPPSAVAGEAAAPRAKDASRGAVARADGDDVGGKRARAFAFASAAVRSPLDYYSKRTTRRPHDESLTHGRIA